MKLSQRLRRGDGGNTSNSETDPFYNDTIVIFNFNDPDDTTNYLNEANNPITPSVNSGCSVQNKYLTNTPNNNRLGFPSSEHFNRAISYTYEAYVEFFDNPGKVDDFCTYSSDNARTLYRNDSNWLENSYSQDKVTINKNILYHYAVSNDLIGGRYRIFRDGVVVIDRGATGTNQNSNFAILGNSSYNWIYGPYCRIKAFRYTKATRYTSNFTPPTLPFPNK
jgi:hypothetical protein